MTNDRRDLAQVIAHVSALWPDGHPDRAKWGCLTFWRPITEYVSESRHYPLDTLTNEAIASQVLRDFPKDGHLYLGVASRRPGLSNSQQGGLADLRYVPGLWRDVDVGTSDAHKRKDNPPDLATARALLAKCGTAPTFEVETGYGLHAYYLFENPVPACQAIADLSSEFHEDGKKDFAPFNLDNTSSLNRVLRVAGTLNVKLEQTLMARLARTGGPRLDVSGINTSEPIKTRDRLVNGSQGEAVPASAVLEWVRAQANTRGGERVSRDHAVTWWDVYDGLSKGAPLCPDGTRDGVYLALTMSLANAFPNASVDSLTEPFVESIEAAVAAGSDKTVGQFQRRLEGALSLRRAEIEYEKPVAGLWAPKESVEGPDTDEEEPEPSPPKRKARLRAVEELRTDIARLLRKEVTTKRNFPIGNCSKLTWSKAEEICTRGLVELAQLMPPADAREAIRTLAKLFGAHLADDASEIVDVGLGKAVEFVEQSETDTAFRLDLVKLVREEQDKVAASEASKLDSYENTLTRIMEKFSVSRKQARRMFGYWNGSNFYPLLPSLEISHEPIQTGPKGSMAAIRQKLEWSGVPFETEEGEEVSLDSWLCSYATNVNKIAHSIAPAKTEQKGNKLVLARSQLRSDLKPVYNAEVDEYLTLFGGPWAEKLKDAMAAFPMTDKALAVLYPWGARRTGKTDVFQAGLASLYSETATVTPLSQAFTKGTSAGICECLVVGANESLGRVDGKPITTQHIREECTAQSRNVRDLYERFSTVVGCIRIVITDNPGTLIQMEDDADAEDVAAVAERVFMFEVAGGHAREEVLPDGSVKPGCARFGKSYDDDVNKGEDTRGCVDGCGLKKLFEFFQRVPTQGWAKSGVFAEHVLWLSQNRSFKRGPRLLVEGNFTRVRSQIADGFSGQVKEYIVRSLLDRPADGNNGVMLPFAGSNQAIGYKQSVIVDKGKVKVSAEGMRANWAQVLGESAFKLPSVRRIGIALSQFSRDREQITVGGAKIRYWTVDVTEVYDWIFRTGVFDAAPIRAKIEASKAEEETPAQKLARLRAQAKKAAEELEAANKEIAELEGEERKSLVA